MHQSYRDIRDKIPEEPHWWDEHGCPRYAPFAPELVPDIYAEEATLMLVACQGCGQEYRVALSFGTFERLELATELFMCALQAEIDKGEHDNIDVEAQRTQAYEQAFARSLAAEIQERRVHYGDPPNTGCCDIGATMNSVPLRTLEYWRRDPVKDSPTYLQWVRDPTLEIDLREKANG